MREPKPRQRAEILQSVSEENYVRITLRIRRSENESRLNEKPAFPETESAIECSRLVGGFAYVTVCCEGISGSDYGKSRLPLPGLLFQEVWDLERKGPGGGERPLAWCQATLEEQNSTGFIWIRSAYLGVRHVKPTEEAITCSWGLTDWSSFAGITSKCNSEYGDWLHS